MSNNSQCQITDTPGYQCMYSQPETSYLTQTRIPYSTAGTEASTANNRAFQQVTPGTSGALNAWSSINGGSISIVSDDVPVSNSLRNSLRFDVPNGLSGPVGFANSGFFGIKVDSAWTYKASFHFRFPTRSSFRGNLVVGLRSSSGEILASATVPVGGASTSWRQVNVSLRPSSSASSLSNQLSVTVDGNAARGQKINFAMFSLFPPTFKNRPNGMRIDIATALAEMKPGVFRFPGGNNLEGQTPASRWQWNATLGSLLDRPGRAGDWSYINTDGLGLLEFLTFCEDVGMEPIMAVWSGFALGGASIAQDQLQPFIQQAIDQINFVIGDARTNAAAARRAALGHPSPFKLNFVEIGNEDFFAADTYTYRWPAFVNPLKSAFPHLKFIATSNINDPVVTPKPQVYDHHVYQTPSTSPILLRPFTNQTNVLFKAFFAQNSFFYDDMARDGTQYFEGEYAAISTNPNDIFGTPADGRLPFPTMQGSAGEAAYMIGMERNSDIVFAAAYAPLLGHVSNSQWTPNLVGFDSGQVFKSTSYYVQQLFSLNKGTEYLPSTLPSRNGTVFWGVTRDRTNLIIKASSASSIVSYP
ncbi:hypothetical protein CCMSSC00406_0002255 [Pleurotus cornucopiae]|uniref:Uncharacterized protein n=1 Tax=Pleurotus cornucopiae TaxID=5321 RepID=A0ACB7J208_PLECO|nr:hypothetical protein CCMSSC00406_0002255 [Pleurotus cornucopiae]